VKGTIDDRMTILRLHTLRPDQEIMIFDINEMSLVLMRLEFGLWP